MIKLGVPQSKDQVKVDNLSVTINNAKLELESINKDKVDKQKELNDVLTKLDFAVEDLENKSKQTEVELSNKETELQKLDKEVRELAKVKFDLEAKVFELNESIELSKELKVKEIAGLEVTEGKKLKSLNIDVFKLESQKKELEQYIEVLSIESSENAVSLESIKKEVSDIDDILKEKQNEDLILSGRLAEVEGVHAGLSTQVTSLTADIDNLTSIIDSLNIEIGKIEEIKSALQSEVDVLNSSKEDFNRERLEFQKNKELILLREQFIIEKYNLAGVPYN